jgi:ribonuclease P protein component
MGVPTSKRLRKQDNFQKVRSLGRSVFYKSFICQYHLFVHDRVVARRLGVIASRRVGNAVKRNRGKRIIRELFRIHEDKLPLNCDIVVILRSAYERYTYKELESHYLSACDVISKSSKT